MARAVRRLGIHPINVAAGKAILKGDDHWRPLHVGVELWVVSLGVRAELWSTKGRPAPATLKSGTHQEMYEVE